LSFLFISNTLFSQIADNIIIAQPNEIVKCAGTNDEYLEIMVNIDLNQYDYYVQWYKENQKFGEPYKNISRLNLPQLIHSLSAKYYAEVWVVDKNSDPMTNILKTEKSNDVLVYVLTKTEIIRNPKTVEKVKIGEKVEFSFDAHIKGIIGSKNNQEVIIEWFKGNKKLEDDKRIIGTKSSLLSISKVQQSDFGLDYRVVVTGECGTDTSNYFGILEDVKIVKVNDHTSHNCKGEIFDLMMGFEINTQEKINYQWILDGKRIKDGQDTSGSNTYNLSIRLFNDSEILLELSIDKYSYKETFKYSRFLDFAKDSTWPQNTIRGFYFNTGPIVYKQPESTKVKVDDYIYLRFFVDKINKTSYTWYKDGEVYDRSIRDVIDIDYAKKDDAGTYYCIATNECGSVTSDTVTVEVEESAFITSVEQEYENSGIAVYPNPIESNSKLILNVEEIGNVNIEIITTTGQVIGNLKLQANQVGKNVIDLNFENLNLSNGVYLLNIQTQNKNYTKVVNYIK
jgi:hypothetical protein